jgi:hypothetical protein
MDKNFTDHSFFYSEMYTKFGPNSLTRSKVIVLFIFTQFTRDLMEVRHLVHYSKWKTCKNGFMSFKIIKEKKSFPLYRPWRPLLIISAIKCWDYFLSGCAIGSFSGRAQFHDWAIISAFRNNVAKLHLYLLHRLTEINNNVTKFWLLLDFQAIHCRNTTMFETVTK